MLSLCFLQPQRIFKQAYYRKQTKNRWARDDPAFAVVQIAFLLVSALASAAALGAQRGITYAYLCFVAVVLHWFTCGVAASSLHASLANRFLREQKWSHSVEQKVEWLYAFDVHCNAFFAYFLVAYVGHFFALPITLGHSFIAMLVANATHTLALSAYFYVTHLGFRTLPY